MENEFLDSVLQKLKEKNSYYMDVFEAEYPREIVIYKFQPAIQYLVEKGFIKTSLVGSQTRLELSPEGERHLLNGGFVAQAKYNNDILKYSKGSRDYARKAYIVAVIGIIVTIILFVIAVKLKL